MAEQRALTIEQVRDVEAIETVIEQELASQSPLKTPYKPYSFINIYRRLLPFWPSEIVRTELKRRYSLKNKNLEFYDDDMGAQVIHIIFLFETQIVY